MKLDLTDVRRRIDAIDDAIAELLRTRLSLVEEARALKATVGRPLYDEAREAELLERHAAWARTQGLDPESVRAVFAAVLTLGRGPRPTP